TLITEADNELVAALVRGDHELSLIKLKKTIGADTVEFATPKRIEEVTKGPLGFSGPVGIKIRIVADRSIKHMKNAVTGANKGDYHLINVNVGRDFEVNQFADIRVASNGDACPRCVDGSLRSSKGIEVGHVFKLGTKYSDSMHATFVDANGKEKPFIMGCYGIGIGRTVAAAIEQNYDENGIVLPISLAPYEVIVLPLNMKDAQIRNVGEDVYRKLYDLGVEVLIDDREESAGIKFKDADLIGIPVHVTVGAKTLKEGAVEIKLRKGGVSRKVKIEEVEREIDTILNARGPSI
ncbi:MAG TPA: YbaK/EbsC family protein, partial [Thermodesulfobacteriota bacterium]